MPIQNFKCPECGTLKKTKVSEPVCPHDDALMELILTAPTANFMEKVDQERNKSAMVDQQKILKERARAHSRDVDMHDLIQNNKRDEAIKNGWLNDAGEKRKAIDDK